jgi:hypothetical protein
MAGESPASQTAVNAFAHVELVPVVAKNHAEHQFISETPPMFPHTTYLSQRQQRHPESMFRVSVK